MKEFLKHTFATVVGVVLVMGLFMALGIMGLVGMLVSSGSTPTVKDQSVLVLKLKGGLNERTEENILSQIQGTATETMGLDQLLQAIRAAKDDDRVSGIYIESGAFWADSPATMQALRNALCDFKQSGKWIVAYADQYTQMGYYLCSVADKVCLNPQGTLDWRGLASQSVYVKDLMAKVGVKMQVVKVGKYKSATEMFVADAMSEPNREQITAYVGGIWGEMLDGVSASRGIDTDSLNAMADNLITFAQADRYVGLGLVDTLLYASDVKVVVKRLLGIDDDDAISQISPADMVAAAEAPAGDDGTVAVYYAVGDVVDEATSSLYSGPCIAGDKVCADLAKLADDDDVKAVVLRVNSGGGSAYASEQIWHAVTKLRQKKPVVVSMGGMAASGGYYLACGSNCIYAEPTTLTGSIGIFGMFPDMSELMTDKLGLKFDHVQTNKYSLFGTSARPFNQDEVAHLSAYIDRGYELFTKRVADGRGMSVAMVDSLGQGRVWLGADAKERHLVDSLGGIDDAIAHAAQLAELSDYATAAYPAKPSWIDQLLDVTTSGGNHLDEHMRQALGKHYPVFSFVTNIDKWQPIQARLPYYITIE